MRKLLIVDDEEGVRSLVRMTLQSESYEILEASDGARALELAREHRPELILLDIAMPGVSGLEVCEELKRDPETSGATVVMLTARAQEVDRNRGEEVEADDYFTKPFSPMALLEKVEQVFGEARTP